MCFSHVSGVIISKNHFWIRCRRVHIHPLLHTNFRGYRNNQRGVVNGLLQHPRADLVPTSKKKLKIFVNTFLNKFVNSSLTELDLGRITKTKALRIGAIAKEFS